MCYSAQSSLIAWVFSVVVGCYLWYRNREYDRWNASFIWTFSMVQLWEAGIWSTNDKTAQGFYLKLIALTLTAQPLVQTFAAWRATGRKHQVLKIISGIYLLIWLYTLYRTLTEHFYVDIGPNGHLVWNSDGGGMVNGHIPILALFYLGGLFLGLLYGIPKTLLLIAVGIITIVWSLSRVDSREFASYWCYTAVGYSVAALFV